MSWQLSIGVERVKCTHLDFSYRFFCCTSYFNLSIKKLGDSAMVALASFLKGVKESSLYQTSPYFLRSHRPKGMLNRVRHGLVQTPCVFLALLWATCTDSKQIQSSLTSVQLQLNFGLTSIGLQFTTQKGKPAFLCPFILKQSLATQQTTICPMRSPQSTHRAF